MTGSRKPDGDAAYPVPRGGRLWRIDDVADRLAVSRSMAWKLVAEGSIRSLKIGRSVRVDPAAVDEFLDRAAREG